jgi:CRP-like cAMP-binding protein
MIPSVRKIISGIIPIKEEYLDVFFSKFKAVSYKKCDYFVKEGQISRYIGFIVKGCLMCVYNNDGKEFIDEFSLDNEFISAYASFITGTPADKDIICLEDSELLILSYSNLQELYEIDPVFERTGRLMAEMLFMNWQQRVKSLLLDNAETRYLRLTENRPDLIQRVPQYHIAQYLGVSPETLSRIRKNTSLQ